MDVIYSYIQSRTYKVSILMSLGKFRELTKTVHATQDDLSKVNITTPKCGFNLFKSFGHF